MRPLLGQQREFPLEYRGIEFVVLQTIPKGWRWSVKRDRGDKAGSAYDREDAIQKAKRYIVNLLRRQARAELGSSPTVEGQANGAT
jgi:hypothetical protein